MQSTTKELIECAAENMKRANEKTDGISAIVCLLGSIANSLMAIAIQNDKNEITTCDICKYNEGTSHNPVCGLDTNRSGGVGWYCADGEVEET